MSRIVTRGRLRNAAKVTVMTSRHRLIRIDGPSVKVA